MLLTETILGETGWGKNRDSSQNLLCLDFYLHFTVKIVIVSETHMHCLPFYHLRDKWQNALWRGHWLRAIRGLIATWLSEWKVCLFATVDKAVGDTWNPTVTDGAVLLSHCFSSLVSPGQLVFPLCLFLLIMWNSCWLQLASRCPVAAARQTFCTISVGWSSQEMTEFLLLFTHCQQSRILKNLTFFAD